MKHLSSSMLPALLLLVCMRQRLGGRLCKLLTADEQFITDRSYHLIVGSFSSIYYMYICTLARMNKRSTHGSPHLFGSSFILLFRHLLHWMLVHGLHTSRDRRRIYNASSSLLYVPLSGPISMILLLFSCPFAESTLFAAHRNWKESGLFR